MSLTVCNLLKNEEGSESQIYRIVKKEPEKKKSNKKFKKNGNG